MGWRKIYHGNTNQKKVREDGSTAWGIQPMILYHLPVVTASDCTSGGEDIIMWVTVESLCSILETNLILYVNHTSIQKTLTLYTFLLFLFLENLE